MFDDTLPMLLWTRRFLRHIYVLWFIILSALCLPPIVAPQTCAKIQSPQLIGVKPKLVVGLPIDRAGELPLPRADATVLVEGVLERGVRKLQSADGRV